MYRLFSFAGCGQNPARQAAMTAGIPKEVPSTTVNMVCGSGLRTVAMGYQAIRCGDASVVVAGGQETMSQVELHVLKVKCGLEPMQAYIIDQRILAFASH